MPDLAWLAAAALLYPLFEAATPRVRVFELEFPRLPVEWDGATFLYLSDSHIRRMGRRERRLARLLEGRSVDLLLLGGDIATGVDGYEVLLAGADGVEARLGRFATWGNSEHLPRVDRGAIAECLRRHGFQVLVNSRVDIERNGAAITLRAVDCPHSGHADFDASFAGAEDGLFQLLLMHAPEGLLQMAGRSADLILSGHTHGGQIRLPGARAFSLHTQSEVDLDRGVFDADRLRRFWPGAPKDAHMVVGAGLGTSTAPVRLFCPPEIVEIRLRHSDDPAGSKGRLIPFQD